jgi:hypothetical protein
MRMAMRVFVKICLLLTIAVGVAAVTLGGYAFFVTRQAESLLKDITALRVGSSSEADVETLAKAHARYLTLKEDESHGFRITFTVRNTWLSTLRLEPPAWFSAAVNVKCGRVYHIGAWLMRSMDIFPTFQASAGDVDEYAEYPAYMSNMDRDNYEFPTPIGKPYLRVLLNAHASPVQRAHAFDFSFRCLIKPGGGCDLPCDYLPSAWQAWKAESRTGGDLDLFNKAYPKNSRCRP